MNPRKILSSSIMLPIVMLANNIQVSNVQLINQNTTNDTYMVQFNLNWDNSWRTSTAEANYDAAWVFLKFRANNGPWQHGTVLGAANPSGGVWALASDFKGAFLARDANGIGNVNFTNCQLAWGYGASGIADNAIIEMRVLAIEMVYIPQGAFYVGDGSTTNLDRQFELGQSSAPFQITSEGSITLGGNGATSLNAHNNSNLGVIASSNDDFNYTTTQSLPAAFPKGFNDHFVMKYELTEGQYVDFLNMLTSTQAANNFANVAGSDGITWTNTGPLPNIYVTTAPERALSGINHIQGAAYADWAALRPMTEFEWEKACRGNIFPLPHEFAWGTGGINLSVYSILNDGASNEAVTLSAQPSANGEWSFATPRVVRAGIFAGSTGTATRTQAGAGYYGAMELSGNVWEHVICVGSVAGRAFTGVNGDGALTATGLPDVSGWPTGASGWESRGAGYRVAQGVSRAFEVSDRSSANGVQTGFGSGGRFCRRP